MIFNITSPEKKTLLDIDAIIGPPFGLLERIKMRGIGSPRFVVIEASTDMLDYLKSEHYVTYANLEIRSEGILVHIDKGQFKFGWPIPYRQLSIFQSKDVAIHSNGSFLRFRGKDPFFKRLLILKAELHEGQDYPPNE